MKCELAQEKIALAVYGELPDEMSHELEHHLIECTDCRQEFEAVRALQQAMFLYPVEEPSANLLVRTRMRLEEALDAVPRRSWFARWMQTMSNGAAHLRTAPVAASLLLIAGLGAGTLAGYHAGQKNLVVGKTSISLASTLDPATEVASISSIVQQPNSENVEVRFNRLVPASVRGSLDDPSIRQMLVMASETATNPGVHEDSLELLARECRVGHQCSGGPVRDALLVALRYDRSPAVRMKALQGLQPYIAEDVRVRDAVLEALMSDSDPRVRTEAISVVQPVEADSSVRRVLYTVSMQDDNPRIRNASQQVLDQLPQIQ